MHILLPTSYFPPISYVALALRHDPVIIEHEETYRKQSIRNHCTIYGPNGFQRLTVPVKKPQGNKTLTKEVVIDESIPWQRQHIKAINTAYNKSPFHLYYIDKFLPVFEKKFKFLTDLNQLILEIILVILKTPKEIIPSEFFEEPHGPGRVFFEKPPFTDSSKLPEYVQVFSSKYGFIPDLSIIDMIFNLGPLIDLEIWKFGDLEI